MIPQDESKVNKAVTQVNDEILSRVREEGWKEGFEEGRKEGRKKAREDVFLEVVSKFKDVVSDEEISRRTGLPIDTIRKL